MKRFKLSELEGKAQENALKDTAMYNDIDFEDAFEQYDELEAIAESHGYLFNEEGERVVFHNGRWMTFFEYAHGYQKF